MLTLVRAVSVQQSRQKPEWRGFRENGRKEAAEARIDKSFKECCCKWKQRNEVAAGGGGSSGELLFFPLSPVEPDASLYVQNTAQIIFYKMS